MKKKKNYLFVLLLSLFSFYYTEKSINFLEEKDPIMLTINDSKEKYEINPINAQIMGNKIIPGINGTTIDTKDSYHKMKKYGSYNETLTVLKEVSPEITMNNQYDKYISRGNPTKKEIALVFKVEDDPTRILTVLENQKVSATFFIDGTFIEKNINLLKNTNQEFELLSYQDEYQSSLFKTSLSYLETLVKNTPKFCYTEEENEEILTLCKSSNLHTIIPTKKIEKNLLKEVKNNLSNALIFSIKMTPSNEKELTSTIQYIKQKGYQLVSLNELLTE